MKILIVLFLSVIFCVSCANLSMGQDFSDDHVQDITIGHTSREQLVEFFGTPVNKTMYDDVEVWEYFVISRGGYRQLVVSIKNDKVFSYSLND